ncbi:MAG: hypothetical protein JWN39_2936 [Ilumatobacteraceae bacterium]|nr:hypothetical protein [Ilumatobacteraceae bacterium]
MIDNDISHELHSLAAAVQEPFDMAALRRRITSQNRRHAVAKVGLAGFGLTAIVGSLSVVRDDRNRQATSSLATASTPAPRTPAPSPAAPQVSALPDCTTALDQFSTAQTTVDRSTLSDLQAAKQAAANVPSEFDFDFKGLVSILTVDGPQITFHVDAPEGITDGAATIDAETRWADGAGPLDATPELIVGQQIGIATQVGPDGAEHVAAIDLSASATIDSAPTSGSEPGKPNEAEPSALDGTKIDVPGDTLAPGPTGKGPGKVTAIDGTSITLSVDHVPGESGPIDVVVDSTVTSFYAGDVRCSPDSLAVGAQAGVAYHLEGGIVIADDVVLVP